MTPTADDYAHAWQHLCNAANYAGDRGARIAARRLLTQAITAHPPSRSKNTAGQKHRKGSKAPRDTNGDTAMSNTEQDPRKTPEYSLDGLWRDFCYWSASLDAVKARYVPPSYHRERWTEEQDAAYVELMPALNAALSARFDGCWVDLATEEGTYADLMDSYPEVFGEDTT